MPGSFRTYDLELVDDDASGGFVGGEACEIDEKDEDEDDGGCECRDCVEPGEGAMHGAVMVPGWCLDGRRWERGDQGERMM